MDEFNKKVESLENEMDIRVESLIAEIHKYRDDYRFRLNNSKTEFQKYFSFSFYSSNLLFNKNLSYFSRKISSKNYLQKNENTPNQE